MTDDDPIMAQRGQGLEVVKREIGIQETLVRRGRTRQKKKTSMLSTGSGEKEGKHTQTTQGIRRDVAREVNTKLETSATNEKSELGPIILYCKVLREYKEALGIFICT